MRATRAVIKLNNFRNNINEIKRAVKPGVKICAAVKANSYGHGAVECAKVAVEEGCEFLSVATADEGIELRENGIKARILIFSLVAPEEIEKLIKYSITPFVSDLDYIARIDAKCAELGTKDFPVHMAVDTGMGRIGFFPEEAGKAARAIADSKCLRLEGMCTHFCVSDSTKKADRKYTQAQFSKFLKAIDNVKAEGIDPGIRHCANSAAIVDLPETHLDMVRPGIILYGYYADQISRRYLEDKGTPFDFKPVMSFESRISLIRKFQKGMSTGYGHTWTAKKETTIAVIPAGYADGWLRRFSNSKILVSVNGKPYPVRGRICMDQCMIDLGPETDVKLWDNVVIFGDKADGAFMDAEDLANVAGTISYEVTSTINKRVPRIYID